MPSVAGHVYDNPAETATMPYVSIGPSYWSDDDAECIEGRSEVIQIDIWASNRPNKAAAKDATDEVAAALKGWAVRDPRGADDAPGTSVDHDDNLDEAMPG